MIIKLLPFIFKSQPKINMVILGDRTVERALLL